MYGAIAASFWLMMLGLFGLDPGHEVLGLWISITSGVILFISVAVVAYLAWKIYRGRPMEFIGRDLIWLFMWLLLAPTFWGMALMRIRAPSRDDISTLLLTGLFMLIVVAFNAVMAAFPLNSRKAYAKYLAFSIFVPAVYLAMPTESKSLPAAVFSGFSFGG
jgi:tryptophan-rich sensory protein